MLPPNRTNATLYIKLGKVLIVTCPRSGEVVVGIQFTGDVRHPEYVKIRNYGVTTDRLPEEEKA